MRDTEALQEALRAHLISAPAVQRHGIDAQYIKSVHITPSEDHDGDPALFISLLLDDQIGEGLNWSISRPLIYEATDYIFSINETRWPYVSVAREGDVAGFQRGKIKWRFQQT